MGLSFVIKTSRYNTELVGDKGSCFCLFFAILDLSFVVYPILSYSKDQFHVRLFPSFYSHAFAIYYVVFIAIFMYFYPRVWMQFLWWNVMV